MAVFKCKMCGANLEVADKATVAECEYCGTGQTLPKLDNDRRASLYDRAGHYRRNTEFDKAESLYEQILNEDTTDAEAYWSLVLCRFGIQYVEDPKTKKRIPTVNRAQRTSIFEDANYKAALEYATAEQKSLYEAEAGIINGIQKEILAISDKEEPYDVFICYKESDANGNRTHDSVLAQELYYGLTGVGFKVFFSRITLENVLGSAYEPHIFAALHSAKVMVVIGTKPEYFNAVWVKNEWSRFLHLAAEDRTKQLIPAYKDMDPYDLPAEFSHIQGQDMTKLGFMQDLIHGIEKIVGKEEKPAAAAASAAPAPAAGGIKPLLTRAFMFLEDKNWPSAQEYSEKVLDMDPECGDAYVAKLCADTHTTTIEGLKNLKRDFSDNLNYQKAIRFCDADMKAKLKGIVSFINERNEEERLQGIYTEAAQLYASATYQKDFEAAAALFGKIPGYKDADERKKTCHKEGEVARKEAIYVKAKECYNSATPSVILSSKEKFRSIPGYKDADELLLHVDETAENARRQNLCNSARRSLNSVNDQAILNRTLADMRSIEAVDPDAKDLAERIAAKIADLQEKERAAQAEKARLEAERVRQIKRRRQKEATGKLIKFLVTAGLIAAVAFGLFYIFYLKPKAQYSDAFAKMENGEYNEAIEIWRDLKDFRDSKAYLMETLALRGAEKADHGSLASSYADFDEIKTIYADLKFDDQEEFKYRYQGCIYKYGEALLLDENKEMKAAVQFGIAIGFEDAKERSFELWNANRTVRNAEIGIRTGASSSTHEGVVLLHSDGTVTSLHGSPEFRSTIEGWKDIVEIAPCPDFLAAIDSQGNIYAAGYYNTSKSLYGWENIVDIDSNSNHNVLYGVRADGTVLYEDEDAGAACTVPFEPGTEAVSISVGQYHVACLTTEGTAKAWNRGYSNSSVENIEGWTDLVQVECSDSWIYAIKSDGTVTTNNTAYFDQLAGSATSEGWSDVKEIRIAGGWGNHIWGVRGDGTVLSTDTNEKSGWRSWTGIKSIAVYNSYVVAVGENGKLYQMNYSEFTEEGVH